MRTRARRARRRDGRERSTKKLGSPGCTSGGWKGKGSLYCSLSSVSFIESAFASINQTDSRTQLPPSAEASRGAIAMARNINTLYVIMSECIMKHSSQREQRCTRSDTSQVAENLRSTVNHRSCPYLCRVISSSPTVTASSHLLSLDSRDIDG